MKFRGSHCILSLAVALITGMSCALSAREDIRLDSGWRFRWSDPEAAEDPSTDDSGWQRVTVPHNYGWDQAQLQQTYYRGVTWYRRELIIDPSQPGPRWFIRFEAASAVADVYLNGHHLGQHRGSFQAFSFELTRVLSQTGTNVLAVRVSNAPERDIAPISGDFNVYGGLYRPVHLIETTEECFAVTDHGSPGVAWLTTSVSPEQAVVEVTAQVSNGRRERLQRLLVARLIDARGTVVATAQAKITLAPRYTAPYSLRLVLPQPHLWNGRKDPYLYKAVIEVQADGKERDSVVQSLGMRFCSVDPEKGFFLNGQPYHLHGVGKHQDRAGRGWAVTEADLEEDVRLIREMGSTAVRCAHYPHSDYFYSLCDKAGLLVWAEEPLVNETGSTPQFAETSRNQLLDMIRQNINHSSIFAWSIFNELWGDRPDPHRLLQDLNNLAHAEDPTRPTVAATATGDLVQMNKIPDLLGWNIYPGWYANAGTKEDFGPSMDDRRFHSRSGGLCISEYGAGANPAHHEDPVRRPETRGRFHPEEWQSLVHEAGWAAMTARPWIWGTFVWNMFDFDSSGRDEGGIRGRNDKGLVTADRKIKKDAFYFYKANWSDEPTVYITSRRFTERTNAVTDIKIYSNAREVELLLNDVSQGRQAPQTNSIFLWKAVKLSLGENRVEARGQCQGQAATDQCVWNLREKQE